MLERFAKPAVRAIIPRAIGHTPCLLMQRRQKQDGGNSNGLLELPGGKLREYENIFDCLRREVFEETALTVTEVCGENEARLTTVKDTSVVQFQPFATVQNTSGLYSLLVHAFVCHADGEPVNQSDESQDIRWIPLDELRQIIERQPDTVFPIDLPFLRQYLSE